MEVNDTIIYILLMMFPICIDMMKEGGEIEAGYPRDMQHWRGVPAHIDGAITWRDGRISDIFLQRGQILDI